MFLKNKMQLFDMILYCLEMFFKVINVLKYPKHNCFLHTLKWLKKALQNTKNHLKGMISVQGNF